MKHDESKVRLQHRKANFEHCCCDTAAEAVPTRTVHKRQFITDEDDVGVHGNYYGA